jgi:N-acetylmuramoyl-L-alanine amidase
MICSARLLFFLLVPLAGLLAGGCVPSGQSQWDEEKEPHFLEGKSRASTLDYKGAIESFEKALEANPRNAAAHFELACLDEQRESDPAAAIYHYDQYLRLRPRAENAEIVRQHIMACKQELAKTVTLGPVTEKVQRELEQLTEQNKRLVDQDKQLRDELDKWRTYAARLESLTNNSRGAPPPPRPIPGSGTRTVGDTGGTPPQPGRTNVSSQGAHTYTVKSGDTPSAIARLYGVKLEALLSANPSLDPRRMRVGQALVIPAN